MESLSNAFPQGKLNKLVSNEGSQLVDCRKQESANSIIPKQLPTIRIENALIPAPEEDNSKSITNLASELICFNYGSKPSEN
jgi:hypothetical protein